MTKYFSMSSFVAGIMLGVLLTGGWFLSGDSSFIPLLEPSSRTATTTTNSRERSTAISVADQSAGMTVMAESVTVPPPGVWIAVREVNGNDLGNVLGAARVGGPRTAVSIPLLRATEPGYTYAVLLYRDDHDGAFDPLLNSVYVDFDTGARAVSYFS
ncbi:MAG: hypothetical protein WCV89_01535, partial [Candidatus Paceibacterota bacterium]